MNNMPILPAPLLAQRRSAVLTPKILRSLPSPAVQPGHLTWDGQYLWHIDHNGNQPSRLLQIDADTGEVLHRFVLPPHINSLVGITDSLWLCNTLAGKIYRWRAEFQRLDWVATLPSRYRIEGGLGFDGSHLWYADARAGKLLAMRLPSTPDDCAIEKVIETDTHIGCLGCIQEIIYFIQNGKPLLGILDTASGRPTRYFELPGIPTGVTFDGRDFWYVDAQLKQINQVRF